MSYNEELQSNNSELAEILRTVNALPNAGGGGLAVQADWNQHDESQPDFIKNKPFGYVPTGGDALSWDGSIEGRENIGGFLYKVSNTILKPEDVANGATLTITEGANSATIEITADWFIPQTDPSGYVIVDPEAGEEGIPLVLIISEDCTDTDTGEHLTAGIYFLYFDLTDLGVALACTSQLSIPGYYGFDSTKLIEKQYLPKITAADVPIIEFYASTSSDKYIYKDAALTMKADKADVTSAKLFIIVAVVAGVQVGIYYPSIIATSEDYASIVVAGKSGIVYTSEYTGT